jgi:hypothetical protein
MTCGSAVRGSAHNGTVDVNVVATTLLDVLVKVVVNRVPPVNPVDVSVTVVTGVVKVVVIAITAPGVGDMESACADDCVGCTPTAIFARLSANLHRQHINVTMPNKLNVDVHGGDRLSRRGQGRGDRRCREQDVAPVRCIRRYDHETAHVISSG